MAPALPQYLWLVITGCLASIGFGFGTGANDVANAFATSVGSKTLKMWHAVVLAAIFEFLGALVLGRVSTSTIAGAIADPKAFGGPGGPEAYAYGMVIALSVGFFWQWWASSRGLNVSATHSIIGAILGFAFVWGGPKAVTWVKPDPKSFPPYKGVVSIVLSWFISPILTAACAALMFLVLRHGVLRRKHAPLLSLLVLPLAVFITTWLNMYFVFTKGAKKTLAANSDWSDTKAAWISAICGGVLAALTGVIGVPLLHKRSKAAFDADGNAVVPAAAAAKGKDTEAQAPAKGALTFPHNTLDNLVPGGATQDETATQVLHRLSGQVRSPAEAALRRAWMMRTLKTIKDVSTASIHADIHDQIEDDPLVAAIHANAEKFSPQVENNFSYLQVFSAIAVIFAHGANEVGYMAGPLTTIWDVYQKGKLADKVNAPIWIIIISAAGLVIGLATYGHHVMRSMGASMAKLTPTRGFCAELATATVIMVAAQSGLPTSSSQCLVGGIVGVGLCESLKAGVNWKLFGQQFLSWIGTIAVVALSTAAVFAQGVYTPNKAIANAGPVVAP